MLAISLLRPARLDERLAPPGRGSRAPAPDAANWSQPATTAEHREHDDRHSIVSGPSPWSRVEVLPRARGRLAAEDEEQHPERVEAGQERADDPGDEEHVADQPRPRASSARIGSFEKKPENGGIADERERADQEREYVNGMSWRRPPIFRMSCSPASAWMSDAGREEEQRLEERVRQQVEHRRSQYAPMPTPTNM